MRSVPGHANISRSESMDSDDSLASSSSHCPIHLDQQLASSDLSSEGAPQHQKEDKQTCCHQWHFKEKLISSQAQMILAIGLLSCQSAVHRRPSARVLEDVAVSTCTIFVKYKRRQRLYVGNTHFTLTPTGLQSAGNQLCLTRFVFTRRLETVSLLAASTRYAPPLFECARHCAVSPRYHVSKQYTSTL